MGKILEKPSRREEEPQRGRERDDFFFILKNFSNSISFVINLIFLYL